MLEGIRILIIGASHLATPGYLITGLHDQLQAKGAQVHSIGVCGVTPSAWVSETQGLCGSAERKGKSPPRLSILRAAHTTPVRTLIAQDQPQWVIVVMGDTLAGYKEGNFSRQWAWTEVQQLTSQLEQSQTRCIWVGPPWGNDGGALQKSNQRVKQVSDFLAEHVAPCRYINSLAMSRPGQWATADGQHFYDDGYRAWSTAITREVLQIVNSR